MIIQNPLIKSPYPCSVNAFLTNATYCFIASSLLIPSLDFHASHLAFPLKSKEKNPGLYVLIFPTVDCLKSP